MAVSPEEIRLCGCWQVIAVQHESLALGQPDAPPTVEVGYCASSLSLSPQDDAAVLAAIRGHWSAIENGTHHRRDMTLGQAANRTADHTGAAVQASRRHLANGIYELEWERERTPVDTLRSWCQQQTFSSAWPLLQR